MPRRKGSRNTVLQTASRFVVESLEKRTLLSDGSWLTYPISMREGQAETFIIDDSQSAEGEATIDFGDGTVVTHTVGDPNVNISHAYADSGFYHLEWSFPDGSGQNFCDEAWMYVVNIAPFATIGSSFDETNNRFKVELTNPTDVQADLTGLTYSFRIGNSGTWSAPSATAFAYYDAQSIETQETIWARIIDKDGGDRDYNAVLQLPDLAVEAVSDMKTLLTWSDFVTGEMAWRVQRYTGDGSFTTIENLPADSNEYIDEIDVQEGTKYFYRVRAVGVQGTASDTGYSAKKDVRTLLTMPDDVRVRLDAQYGPTVYWQDRSSLEASYEVTWTNPDNSTGSISTKANGTAALLPATVASDAAITVRAESECAQSAAGTPNRKSEYAYLDEFDSPATGYATGSWSGGDTQSYASVTYGSGQDHFRGLFTSSATLNLSKLPTHSAISYGFQIIYIPNPNEPNDNPEFTVSVGGETFTPVMEGFSGWDVHSSQWSSTRLSYVLATSSGNVSGRTIPHHGETAALTINCTGNAAGGRWGVFSMEVKTEKSIVTIEAMPLDDYSKEGEPAGSDHEKATLRIQRLGNLEEPMEVPVSVLEGSDATNYTDLPGSVTFEPGEWEVLVNVKASDDTTPEWTQKLKVGIEADLVKFLIIPSMGEGKVELVDDDCGISALPSVVFTNNNDNNSDLITDNLYEKPVPGDPDLYPVNLAFPDGTRPFGWVSLSSTLGYLSVWETADRSGTHFIKAGQESYTWFMNETMPALPDTVYVEGLSGTTVVNGVPLVLAFSEGPGVDHPTTGSATASCTTVEIAINYNEVNDGNWFTGVHSGRVTGRLADKVMIGDRIALGVTVVAPEAWVSNLQYNWTAPGDIFADYVADNAFARKFGVIPEDLVNDQISYYWNSTRGLGGNARVSCNVALANGQTRTADTFFQVFEPAWSFTATATGTTNLVNLNNELWVQLMNPNPNPFADGIRFVQEVNGAPWPNPRGQYFVVQTLSGLRSFVTQNNERWVKATDKPVLDTRIPYPIFDSFTNIDFDYGPMGMKSWTADSPGQRVDGTWNGSPKVSTWIDREFQMYLMFKPYGNSARSVPLAKINWSWTVCEALLNGIHRIIDSAGESPTNAVREYQHPEWDDNITNAIWVQT